MAVSSATVLYVTDIPSEAISMNAKGEVHHAMVILLSPEIAR
jgi:hypothetical protein